MSTMKRKKVEKKKYGEKNTQTFVFIYTKYSGFSCMRYAETCR